MIQGFSGVLFVEPFAVMNTVGLVAFALVGSAKAIRNEFDLFGITVVGLAMAFAGGATRDILVNRVPLVLQSPIEISLGLLGVGLAVGMSVVLDSPDAIQSCCSPMPSDSLRSRRLELSSQRPLAFPHSVLSLLRRSMRSVAARSRIFS
jgi:hypothetical protein